MRSDTQLARAQTFTVDLQCQIKIRSDTKLAQTQSIRSRMPDQNLI